MTRPPRCHDATAMIVAVNAGPAPTRLVVEVPELARRALAEVVLPGGDPASGVAVTDGWAQIEIPGRSGRVLKVEASHR